MRYIPGSAPATTPPTDTDFLAAASAANKSVLVLQMKPGQSAPALRIEDSAGADVAVINSTGFSGDGSQLTNLPHGSSSGSDYDAENKDASDIDDGAACSVHSSGTGVVLAVATDATQPAVGLALAGAAPTFSATVQTDGLFTLADWTGVTDEASVTLSSHAIYFLSPTTPGHITVTPPAAGGQALQRIGRAVSSVTLDLSVEDPILL